jgi:ribose transport system substrate-binding protein
VSDIKRKIFQFGGYFLLSIIKGAAMKNLYLGIIIIISMLISTQNIAFTQGKMKIMVIPKGNDALFWKSVMVGTKLGTTALSNVEIIWKAPAAEDDLDQQISIFDQAVSENLSGIILSPINQNELVKSVAKAMEKNIPVLIFDSPLKGTAGKDFISFVGINNRKAGSLAGDHMASLLKGSGKVVLLRYVKGQANTSEREEGFIEALKKYDKIKLIEKDLYAGGSLNEAKKASKSILNKLNEANGVFCPNEVSTMGMLFTLQESKLAGKIKFVGFDTPPVVVDALKKGEVDALIAQDPARMGFQSVKTLVDHIRGKKVPSNVDVDIQVVTQQNLANPEIQKLLSLPE